MLFDRLVLSGIKVMVAGHWDITISQKAGSETDLISGYGTHGDNGPQS